MHGPMTIDSRVLGSSPKFPCSPALNAKTLLLVGTGTIHRFPGRSSGSCRSGGPQHGGYEHDVAFRNAICCGCRELRKQRSLGITPSTDSSLKNRGKRHYRPSTSVAQMMRPCTPAACLRAKWQALRETPSISLRRIYTPRPSPMPRVNWVNFPT